MKRKRKPLSVFAFLSFLMLAHASLRGDVILLSDAMSAVEPVLLHEADTTAQSGAAAPTEYLVASGDADGELAADQVWIEERGLMVENRNAAFVSISPAFNFDQSGGDSFRVRIDIAPEPGGTTHSDHRWAHIHFGGDKPNRFVAAPGFGVLIRSDASREDGYQIFHDGEHVASGSVPASGTYRFDIVVEDGEIAFTINGKLQAPFADGSSSYPVGALRLGYVTFGAHNAAGGDMSSGFSNFSLSRLAVTSGSLLILSSAPPGEMDDSPCNL